MQAGTTTITEATTTAIQSPTIVAATIMAVTMAATTIMGAGTTKSITHNNNTKAAINGESQVEKY